MLQLCSRGRLDVCTTTSPKHHHHHGQFHDHLDQYDRYNHSSTFITIPLSHEQVGVYIYISTDSVYEVSVDKPTRYMMMMKVMTTMMMIMMMIMMIMITMMIMKLQESEQRDGRRATK